MADQFLGCQLKLTISGKQCCNFCKRGKNFKMNASAVVLLLAMVFVAFASAFPSRDEPKIGLSSKLSEDEQLQLLEDELTGEEERGLRFRRVTCDLLSVSVPWGSLNHSACAAHCLSMNRGYKGGRCKDGVCHCRK